jgi:hypothetical protein
LLYTLIRRLELREPVALQVTTTQFVIFYQDGVKLSESVDLAPSYTGESHQPCIAFQYSIAHVIHTSSKQWVKHLSASVYFMDVWSQEELQVLLYVVSPGCNRHSRKAIYGGPSPSYYPIRGKLIAQSSEHTLFHPEDLDLIFVKPNEVRRPDLYIPTSFLSATLGIALACQARAEQHTCFWLLESHPTLGIAAQWCFENYGLLVCSDSRLEPLQLHPSEVSISPQSPKQDDFRFDCTKKHPITFRFLLATSRIQFCWYRRYHSHQ